jgi:IclR family transcriptional regulator, acetate operon repressor
MNKGTVRVLETLTLFSRQPRWGVTEASRALDCGKNTAFQALDTLVREGYVVRDADGKGYRLGHGALSFAGEDETLDVRALCRPTLERLHAMTGESVFLSIIVGRDHVCIDSLQPPGASIGYSPLSRPVPLHAGAGARLLLSHLEDAEIARYIEVASPLEKFTPATITDPEALWEEVRKVRAQGFSRGYGDYSTGATFISLPVIAAVGRPLAAITIGGPAERFTRADADAALPQVRTVIDELNRRSRMFPAVPMARF